MSDKKISQLTAITPPIAGTDVLPVVQGSTTKKITVAELAPGLVTTYVNGGVVYASGSNAITTSANLYFDGANLGVGTNTPSFAMDVNSNVMGLGPKAASVGNGANFRLRDDTGTVRWLTGILGTAAATAYNIYDLTASATRLSVSSVGNVTVNTGNLVIGTAGKGIDFSADPSAAGMTSELLADYEEGTWTPTITGSTTNPTVTYGLQRGVYTKVGRVVTVSCFLSWSAISGGSGNARISGLPFTVESSTGANGAGAISELDGFTLASLRTSASMFTSSNTTFLTVRCFGSTVSTQTVAIADLAATGSLIFTATYSV
jgi:hypothetical protein